ncbi:MAG: hypothetical protein B7Z48_06200, partial [Thiotrichales bacterium 12-47-6]
MSIKPMLLPDIGDLKGVDVIEILVKEGDVVAVDDALLVLESDKATMEIPSPMAGKIVSLKVKVGDKVATGVLIAEVEADESVAAVKTAAAPQPTSAPAVAVASTPVSTAVQTPTLAPTMPVEKPINAPVAGAKAHASPSVRLFARELGVDLSLVTGTGVKGRISKDDVQAFVKGAMSGAKTLPNVAGAAGGMGIPSIK